MGDTWYLDELFVTIQGRQQYLWRAVDEDGDVIDILVQSRRNRRAAMRFFRKLLKARGPRTPVHGLVQNLFRVGRRRSVHHRLLRSRHARAPAERAGARSRRGLVNLTHRLSGSLGDTAGGWWPDPQLD